MNGNIDYHYYLKYFKKHIGLVNQTREVFKIRPKYCWRVFGRPRPFTFVQLTAASIKPPRVQSNIQAQHFKRHPTEPKTVVKSDAKAVIVRSMTLYKYLNQISHLLYALQHT